MRSFAEAFDLELLIRRGLWRCGMWLKSSACGLAAGVLIGMWMGGCKSNDGRGAKANQPPPAVQPPTSGDPTPPIMGSAPYAGPPVTVKLLQLQTYPPQNVVSIQLTAPTGGWKLTLDSGEVIEKVAKAYFTLERPGKGEMVTQSLVQLNSGYKTTSLVDRAEIYINLTQRGVQS